MADVAFDYHERTKHHFHRHARSLGYMDWATQPDPFRTFAGSRRVELGFELEGPGRPAVADLLFHSLAISAWKAAGGTRWALRVNPSSGNLHPTEGYLVLPAVDGISDAPGVWHYAPKEHALEERCRLSPEAWAGLTAGLPEGSFLVGLTSILWREAWKYGERAFRYCQHDTGHAIAAVAYAAALRGRQVRLLDRDHDTVAAILGTDREADFPVPEEREEPETLAVVSPVPLAADPAPPPSAVLGLVRAAPWTGRANRLSAEHHDWLVIAEVAAASRVGGAGAAPSGGGGDKVPDPVFPRERIRRRRSAVAFDGESTVPAAGFHRMLGATMPGSGAPFAALGWEPAIDLALFVHRVDGVEPGLYLLVRSPDHEPRLRAAMRRDFRWQAVGGDLPLFLLAPGGCEDLAARVSCRQDIAGDSFFSLGMIADFEGPIRAHGPGFYRRLFWEAGAVGQALYLAAEAEGARGTGIGCYYDDPVHAILGLEGREFQSLYHFTIGIAVDDDRLTTLPAYEGVDG